ncbi:MAG: DUF3592 domain-containing protein [Candidatus Wallbacteria bacterium]|nr:DUF3592 domain-containing protein [Candidatus Wallbacteria bacterium]
MDPSTGTGLCRVCGEALTGPSVVSCVQCETPTHRDCFRYAGACPLYGCGGTRWRARTRAAASSALGAADRLAARIGLGAGRVVGPGAGSAIELDYHSGLEMAADWMVSAGLVGLGAVALVGPHPHVVELSSLAAVLCLLVAAAGTAIGLLLEDLYVFDPGKRLLLAQRRLPGFAWRRPVAELSDFTHVGTATAVLEQPTAGNHTARYEPVWLVLRRKGGPLMPLGDAAGGSARYSPGDLERIATRIGSATGLPVQLDLKADRAWWAAERFRISTRSLLWMACISTAAAFAWDVSTWRTALALPLLAPAALVLAAVLYWWLVPLPRKLAEPAVLAKRKKDDRAGGVLVALLCFASLPWLAHQNFEHIRALLYFERAPCEILDSRLTEHVSTKGHRSYSVSFRFRYEVGGRVYDRWGYDLEEWRFWWHFTALRAHASLEHGARASCWYDPADPARAVVDRSLSFTTLLLMALSLFGVRLAVEGLLAWYLARQKD